MVFINFFCWPPSHSSSKKILRQWGPLSRLMNTYYVFKNSLPPTTTTTAMVEKPKTLWRSIWIQNLVAVVSGDMFFVSKASLFHQWWQGVKPPWCFVNCEVAVEPGVNPFLKNIYLYPSQYLCGTQKSSWISRSSHGFSVSTKIFSGEFRWFCWFLWGLGMPWSSFSTSSPFILKELTQNFSHRSRSTCDHGNVRLPSKMPHKPRKK